MFSANLSVMYVAKLLINATIPTIRQRHNEVCYFFVYIVLLKMGVLPSQMSVKSHNAIFLSK